MRDGIKRQVVLQKSVSVFLTAFLNLSAQLSAVVTLAALFLLAAAFVQLPTPARHMVIYWVVAMDTTTPPLWTTFWKRWELVTPTLRQ